MLWEGAAGGEIECEEGKGVGLLLCEMKEKEGT